jgi:hypothetical protein
MSVREFHLNIPEEELAELRRRIKATRWPDKETVTEPNFSQPGSSPNWGQGVQLATIQKLADYWANNYDWRKVEARLNALPQFITNIDGLDIPYNVNATNIKGVTAGHIHFGKAGENGPIVFTMFKYDPPKDEVIETGTITADKLEGPLKGKQVSDLAFAGANGSLYMNIHTVENPNGEIRGTSSIPP